MSCIRDFSWNLYKKPSFIIHFSSVFETVLSYSHEMRYAIVLCYDYRYEHVNSFSTRCAFMHTQPTTSVWQDENLCAWESPWLYPKMGPWAHLLIGQFKWKRLDYWLNYYNRWKALLLTNRLTSIVDIVCISDFWDIWGWNHMTNYLWFASAIDLVGLHLHVLGAVVRKGKLHYFVPQFYFLIWFIPILTEWKWKHYSNFCFDSA